MPEQIEGPRAVALAVALARPQVICAHPSEPQARIVAALREMAMEGLLADSVLVDVESESAALSVAIGAVAAGARAYTAASSQGLPAMAQAVYGAGGLGSPIVMTIGNRAVGAPGEGASDHSDSMPMRDAGWIQLYAESGQDALDLHIFAFRLAEELSCPVMVCMDEPESTPAAHPVEIPTQAQVDAFLPRFEPRHAAPTSIAGGTASDAFMELRYLAHHKHLRALSLAPQLAAAFAASFGRHAGELLRTHRHADAETIVVALGSVNGTVREVVDAMREDGTAIGAVAIGSFRPFPVAALREALQNAKRVVVLEKSLAVGLGGIVSDGVRRALPDLAPKRYTVIAGLGGRAVTRASLRQLFEDAAADELEQVTFLDLNAEVVAHELEREQLVRRSGAAAEAILRRLGNVGSRID